MDILIPSEFSLKRRKILSELYEMRDDLQKRFTSPTYGDDWRYYYTEDGLDPTYINCYAYAMQLHRRVTYTEKEENIWYQPGFLSGEFCQPYTSRTIIPAFLSDLEFLGMDVRKVDVNAPYNPDSYKISIFIDVILRRRDNASTDFHFLRQDLGVQNLDESWSHKLTWSDSVARIKNER